jgi:hypothetical protein
MSSIAIPVKRREVSTLLRIALWEVSSSTNAVLGNKKKNKKR